jgi:hypothetical protein
MSSSLTSSSYCSICGFANSETSYCNCSTVISLRTKRDIDQVIDLTTDNCESSKAIKPTDSFENTECMDCECELTKEDKIRDDGFCKQCSRDFDRRVRHPYCNSCCDRPHDNKYIQLDNGYLTCINCCKSFISSELSRSKWSDINKKSREQLHELFGGFCHFKDLAGREKQLAVLERMTETIEKPDKKTLALIAYYKKH